jgi:hypothetical protein
MLTLTGGKQDLQMVFGLIIFSLIYKSIAKQKALLRKQIDVKTSPTSLSHSIAGSNQTINKPRRIGTAL